VTPIIAYWLARSRLRMYDTLILGTFVMGAPAFILTLGPIPSSFLLFTLFTTIGEAIWQPLFLEYATKIAPPGQEAHYSGISNFPWFLTKSLTPLFSGWFMATYCPATGPLRTETMWFWYGLIAISTPALLLLARFWVMRDKQY
jgi:dipeptide/tripeptide permease